MFGAIASTVGNLFGTKAAGERMIEGITDAADKLFYTKEERAEDAAKAKSEGMQVYMAWLESTSGSRLARRFIATSVTGLWLIQQSVALMVEQAAIFASNPATIQKLVDASTRLFERAQENNELVGVVLLFYFGGPVAIDGVKALVTRWTNRDATDQSQR